MKQEALILCEICEEAEATRARCAGMTLTLSARTPSCATGSASALPGARGDPVMKDNRPRRPDGRPASAVIVCPPQDAPASQRARLSVPLELQLQNGSTRRGRLLWRLSDGQAIGFLLSDVDGEQQPLLALGDVVGWRELAGAGGRRRRGVESPAAILLPASPPRAD